MLGNEEATQQKDGGNLILRSTAPPRVVFLARSGPHPRGDTSARCGFQRRYQVFLIICHRVVIINSRQSERRASNPRRMETMTVCDCTIGSLINVELEPTTL